MRVRRLGLLAMLAAAMGGVAPAAADDIPIPGPTGPVPGPSGSPIERLTEQPSECTIEGTEGPDRLVGTTGADVICGEGGDDVLEGLEGDDVLDGGDGIDTATWESSLCCVRADLGAGSASGALGADVLEGIENLTGSQGADVLRGDALANAISGLGATDLLYGGDGDDWLTGGDGDDWLAGEVGANVLDGGAGANICADGAGTLCDPPDPGDPSDTRGILDIALVDASPEPGVAAFRVTVRRRMASSRLWDEGYVVVSFDGQGGDEPDVHAVVVWTKRRPRGVLIGEGDRKASGRLQVRRAGGRGVLVRVPLGRVGIHPERPYYRWTARSIFTGPGCKPCFDTVPNAGAYPQPLV
jgi:hypothetical protein